MRRFLLAIYIIMFSMQLYAEQADTQKTTPILKHEIGFSVGALPMIGTDPPKERFMFPMYMPLYLNHKEFENGMYEKRYHLGSYAFNYNYHYDLQTSIGISLSWFGIHNDIYNVYHYNRYSDTIDATGWFHYFTLLGNYRRTYYKDDCSLYFEIYLGGTLCLRNEKIVSKEYIHTPLFTNKVNYTYFFDWNMHLNIFGIEIGTKHIFNAEIGLGALGIIRAGYRYKFEN